MVEKNKTEFFDVLYPNNKMYRRILIILMGYLCVSNCYGQYDPQFSQNMFNIMAINPAYAGTSNSVNLLALNRNQWRGDYAVKTTVFNGNMPLNLFGSSSGVGLNFTNDEIGFYTNLTIALSYAYHLELQNGTLSLGFNVGLLNQKFDGSQVRFPSEGNIYVPNDPSIVESEVNGSAFDAGLGVYYSSRKYYFGVSLLHINTPKPNFKDEFKDTVGRVFYVTGGYRYKIDESLYEWIPSLYMSTDGRSFQIDVNALLKYKNRYWGGLTYRLQDAIIILAGIEMKNGIRFGYSYDINTSAVASAGKGGSHEVMIGYDFDLSFEKRTKRYKSVRYL